MWDSGSSLKVLVQKRRSDCNQEEEGWSIPGTIFPRIIYMCISHPHGVNSYEAMIGSNYLDIQINQTQALFI
jgi:hypothetical protein